MAKQPTDNRVTVRLDVDTVTRVDAMLAKLIEAADGVELTRSDAVRVLVRCGLDTWEGRRRPE